MILACSFCNARYLVSASLFAAGPRTVRCVRCSHKWVASADDETLRAEQVSLIDVAPPPEAVAPIPPGSNLPVPSRSWTLPDWLPRALRLGSAAVFALLLLVLVLDRQSIAKQWPFLETVYEVVGLHIYETGEGLKIRNVRSELRFDDGIMRLNVQGEIYNDTKKNQLVPALLASAMGSGGDVLQSWQIDPPAPRLEPMGSVAFSSVINAPKETVVEINLNFVEAKNASE